MAIERALSVGDVVLDRFRVVELAGQGALAEVFRAHDRNTGREVALKALASTHEQARERFKREAEVLQRIESPSVVAYVDHGEENERAYLAMQWVSGEPLSERLKRGRLSVTEAMALSERVLAGLAAMHAVGVLHRDIKPENIMLDEGDVARAIIVDLGLVREGGGASQITHAGSAIGTPLYMAPEQARGDLDLSERTDVYGFACVLYEALTGRTPFEADHPLAALTKAILEPVVHPCRIVSDIGEKLGDAIERALAKRPEDRPASATAFLAALRDATQETPAIASRPGVSLPPPSSLAQPEHHFVSIAFARPAAEDAISVDLQRRAKTLLEKLAARGGAIVEPLLDGSIVVVWGLGEAARASTAREQAIIAADCALTFTESFSGSRVTVCTGRESAGARSVRGAIIDEAAILPTSAQQPVTIDSTSTDLVRGHFACELVVGDIAGAHAIHRTLTPFARTPEEARAPLVGREAALAAFDEVWTAAIEKKTPANVVVRGESGVGLSRWMQAIHAGCVKRGALVLSVRCEPMQHAAAFSGLRRLLHRLAGGQDEDADEVLLRAVLDAVLDPEESRRVGDAFAALLRARTGERAFDVDASGVDADFVRTSLSTLLEELSRSRPVLIGFDDAQWMDEPTRTVLEGAFDGIVSAPVVLLRAMRQTGEAGSASRAFEILLEPLSEAHAHELVVQLLGHEGDEVERIVRRSRGNPLWIEELVRRLEQAEQGGRDALGSTAARPTLESLIEGRLLELDEGRRSLLMAASVFNRPFGSEALGAALGDADRTGLEDRLRSLVESGWLAHGSGPLQYRFENSVYRDTCYKMIDPGDKRALHAAVGRWLASRAQAEPAEVVQHYLAAEDREEALAWSYRAVERALEANDFARVIEEARTCKELGIEGQPRGEVLVAEARAFEWMGQAEEGRDRATAALVELRPGSWAWGRAVHCEMLNTWRLRQREALEAQAKRLVDALAGPHRDAIASQSGVAQTAFPLQQAGLFELADAILEPCSAAAARHGQGKPTLLGAVHQSAALKDYLAGRYVAAARHFVQSVAAYEAAGRIRAVVTQRGNLAAVYLMLGGYPEAEGVLRQVRSDARRLGLGPALHVALVNLCWALHQQRRYDEALEVGAEVVAATSAAHDAVEAIARFERAAVYLALGELEQAGDDANEAVRLAASSAAYLPNALATRAEVRLKQGELQGAVADAEEARAAMARTKEVEGGRPRVDWIDIRVRLALGDRAQAIELLARALADLAQAASKIEESSWRLRFLTSPPEHEGLRDLAARFGVEDPTVTILVSS